MKLLILLYWINIIRIYHRLVVLWNNGLARF